MQCVAGATDEEHARAQSVRPARAQSFAGAPRQVARRMRRASFRVPAAKPPCSPFRWPSRTMTRSCSRSIVTDWPPAPRMANAVAGRSGRPCVPLTQNWPPSERQRQSVSLNARTLAREAPLTDGVGPRGCDRADKVREAFGQHALALPDPVLAVELTEPRPAPRSPEVEARQDEVAPEVSLEDLLADAEGIEELALRESEVVPAVGLHGLANDEAKRQRVAVAVPSDCARGVLERPRNGPLKAIDRLGVHERVIWTPMIP